METFDIVIAGGGPAGSAAAIRARQLGLSVALVTGTAPRAFAIGETVPPDISPLLHQLGSADILNRGDHVPCPGACSAWCGAELEWHDGFTSVSAGGWRLRRSHFDAALRCRAQAANARVFEHSTVAHAARAPDAWHLTLRSTEVVRARYLIDASGRAACLARKFGAVRISADNLVAVSAVLPAEDESEAGFYTLVEAASYGWWYLARLPDRAVLVSLFTDADIWRPGIQNRVQVWRELLERTSHVSKLSPGCASTNNLFVTSAASFCLHRLFGEGWIAVGDAATAWDPLASAGICHALRTGIEAAEAIHAANSNICSFTQYQRSVQLRYTRYLLERKNLYAIQMRWPQSVFWRRRRSVPHRRAPESSEQIAAQKTGTVFPVL